MAWGTQQKHQDLERPQGNHMLRAHKAFMRSYVCQKAIQDILKDNGVVEFDRSLQLAKLVAPMVRNLVVSHPSMTPGHLRSLLRPFRKSARIFIVGTPSWTPQHGLAIAKCLSPAVAARGLLSLNCNNCGTSSRALSVLAMAISKSLPDNTQTAVYHLPSDQDRIQVNVSGWHIGDPFFSELSLVLHSKSLVSLDLHGSGPADLSAMNQWCQVLSNPEVTLTHLDLSGYTMADEGFLALCKGLSLNHSLTDLNISNTLKISSTIAAKKALGSALLSNRTLTNLDCSFLALGNTGCQQIGRAIRKCNIISFLDISGCQGDGSCGSLLRGLSPSGSISLRDLRLTDSDMTDEDGLLLASLLEHQTLPALTRLDISRVALSSKVVTTIAVTLRKCEAFTSFGFNGGRHQVLGSSGVIDVIKALQRSRDLKELALAYQDAGDSAAQALANLLLLPSSAVQRVNFTGNVVGNKGATALCNAIATIHNRCKPQRTSSQCRSENSHGIMRLSLEDNVVSQQIAVQLQLKCPCLRIL